MTFTEVNAFCARGTPWMTTWERRCVSCPECQSLLWRSGNFWSCPRGHGKLLCEITLRGRFGCAEEMLARLRKEQDAFLRAHTPPRSRRSPQKDFFEGFDCRPQAEELLGRTGAAR